MESSSDGGQGLRRRVKGARLIGKSISAKMAIFGMAKRRSENKGSGGKIESDREDEWIPRGLRL